MPLSLRRPKRHPQPALTPDNSRSVSTPTLLSRLRNSTFSRSKASLLSSLAYESVRARTPPTPYSPSVKALPEPTFKAEARKAEDAKIDRWEKKGFMMSKEQRECLAGAECLGIWNPFTGENGMSFPFSRVDIVEMPQMAYSPSTTSTVLDDISEITIASDSSASTRIHESFDHLSRFLPTKTPTKLADIFTPPPPPSVFTPYRKITLRSRVREAKMNSAFGSPVMVPLRPESPDPKTPTRSSENSPDWTPISVPQTPLSKMGFGSYQ
jgi:hypothetical protein